MNKLILLLLLLVILGAAFYGWTRMKTTETNKPAPIANIATFEECVAAGNPVMESYPRQCNTPDGKHFTENIGNANEMIDLITVNSPRPNDFVKSPLTISGQARGNWYFEASFPVKLFDARGELAKGIAAAQGEWMTTDFVPFTAILEFNAPTTSTGTLILKNDNPSGLPENDKQLTIPVKF